MLCARGAPVGIMLKHTPSHQYAPPNALITLASLPNLGPKSAQFLLDAGITSHAQLQRLGAVRAYTMVKRVQPRASLNLLWALEGALSGLHWRVVAKEHRTSLMLALDAHDQSLRRKPHPSNPCSNS